MADQAAVRRNLSIFLQKASAKRAKSIAFKQSPLLYFLYALSGQKTGADDLGMPVQVSKGTNASAAGFSINAMTGISKAQMAKILAEREYRPLLHSDNDGVSDIKSMSDYDNVPDVASWTTNSLVQRMVQPVVRFARLSKPWSIPHTDRDTAVSSGNGVEGAAARALGSLYDKQVRLAHASLMTKQNNQLLGIDDTTGAAVSSGNGLPADESANQWSSIHSVKQALHNNDNVYCGVDRSLSTCPDIWKGIYTTATTRSTFEELIDDTNITNGIADWGGGIELIGVGKALWLKAKAEAKSEHTLMWTNQIPEFAEFGATYEVVRITTGNKPVYVYYEPKLPAGECFLIDPKTWTVAIHPRNNYRVNGPIDETETTAGGRERDFGQVHVEFLAVCETPAGNRYCTDFG